MKHLLSLSALLMAFALTTAAVPAHAQYSGVYAQQDWHRVLSADDQSHFDKYYAKWVEATRKNDQDDISGNARHMQDIMAHYNIPQNVPFDQIASNSGAYGSGPYQGAYPAGAYPNGPYQNAYPAYGQTRLSPDDQRQFDKAYSKWMDATRKNDRDDIGENARKMQDIMARYNIPSNVPFAQVATGGEAGAYPNSANGYPYAGNPYAQQQRLSADDQHNFDKDYKHWVDARRKNDRDDIDKNARRMQDIMARYNIPANVPFDRIASPDAANR